MERGKKVLLTTLHAKKDSISSPKKGFGQVKKDVSSEAKASEVNQVNKMMDDEGRPVPDGAAVVVQVEDGNRGVAMSDEDIILNTKMFKSDRLRREDILNEKIKRLQAEDELIASDPSVGAVPELVADRMIRRIAVFFGVPVFGGLSIFVGAFFYSKKYDATLPPVIVAYATQLPFVIGLLGITYGILSSSWDNEPGSALGIREFKTNLKRIQDGLTRTKETAELRTDIEKEQEKLQLGRKKK